MTLFTLASSPAGLVFRVRLCFPLFRLREREGERDRDANFRLSQSHRPLALLTPLCASKPRALCARARAVVVRYRPAAGEARAGEVQGATRAEADVERGNEYKNKRERESKEMVPQKLASAQTAPAPRLLPLASSPSLDFLVFLSFPSLFEPFPSSAGKTFCSLASGPSFLGTRAAMSC